MNTISNAILIARRRSSGQALVEYALILAFISVVAVCVLMFLGVQLSGVYQTIIDALDRVRMAIGGG